MVYSELLMGFSEGKTGVSVLKLGESRIKRFLFPKEAGFGLPIKSRRRSLLAQSNYRSRRKIAVIGSVVSSSLILAACGGSSTSSTATTAAPATTSGAPIPITFWEAMSGPLGSDLAHLVDQYNASQSRYKVEAIYKGTYPETLAATVAAFRAHNAPDITQIFDVGTATMMDSTGVYTPLYKLMAQEHIPFSTSDFIGAAGSYYATEAGNLDSMPFNSSTPVLYYNKQMLAAIGASPPATWAQVGTVGKELVAHGAKCGFSTGWPDWTQFEQFAVWNGYPYATADNGYKATKGVKLLIDTPPFVNHLAQLRAWSTDGTFKYDGRESTAEPLFINGTCGMYIDSSASYAAIAKGDKVPFGVAPLPYDSTSAAAPQNTVVGGASLWVMSSAPKNTLPGIAGFLKFLMSGPSQAYWAAQTGYVAVTGAGVTELTNNGFYKAHPYAMVAVKELTNKPPLTWTRGIRLGDLTQIRNIENSAMTAVLSGTQTPQQALSTAQSQANAVLANFASTYGG